MLRIRSRRLPALEFREFRAGALVAPWRLKPKLGRGAMGRSGAALALGRARGALAIGKLIIKLQVT
jgi:hypothetical protein